MSEKYQSYIEERSKYNNRLKRYKDKLLRKEGDSTNIVFDEVDSLIGGFVIQSGDEVLDLSIKGRLKKLVNQLNI